MVTRRRIIGHPFLLVVSTSSATSSFVIVDDEETQQFPEFNNDVDRRVRYERYYYDTEEEDGNDNDNLITIPMRSRASVLKERNLLHLLDEERSMDASETFAKWVRSSHNNRHRRGTLRLGGSSSSSTNNDTALFHSDHHRTLQAFSGEGTHFLNAYIGTPAQKRVLAINSAADFTAFPCEGCGSDACGPILTTYLQSSSTSFLPMPCGRCVGGQREDVCDSETRTKCVARGYNLVDKSAWMAYEARDNVYVGGLSSDEMMSEYGTSDVVGTDITMKHGFPLVFGCQTEATGWYASQVKDGIVGLSMARTSLINQMVLQDQLKYPRFCMCFEQTISMGDDGVSSGVLILGGYNPNVLDHPLVYVQNVEKMPGTRYKIYVNAVYLRKGGGQSIVPDRDGQQEMVRLSFDPTKFNEKNGGTILDSGVPILAFDESIQQSFLEEWKNMVGSAFTLGKVLMTQTEIRQLPTIIIQIRAHDGVDKSFNPKDIPNMAGDRDPDHPFDGLLAVPATHYMEYNPSTNTYRAKMTLDSKLGSFLGINVMHGHLYYYDLLKDRIGFAESYNCRPKLGLAGLTDDDMFEVQTLQGGSERPDGGFGDGGFGDDGDGSGNGFGDGDGDGSGDKTGGYGTCVTATCISFVTLGYCIVIIGLSVAYRKYRPRDRSKRFGEEMSSSASSNDVGLDDEHEMINPAFDINSRIGSSGRSSSDRRSSLGSWGHSSSSDRRSSFGSRGSFI